MSLCERCQGNGEIVIDWDRYLKSRPGDRGDEAVADCPDCDGTGEAHTGTERLMRHLATELYKGLAVLTGLRSPRGKQ